jgi:hypothetical protein
MTTPTLTSLSPTSDTADNNTHLMTLFGSNFVSGDTLTYVDPHGNFYTNRTPAVVSSSELQYPFNSGSDPGIWEVEVISSAVNSSFVTFLRTVTVDFIFR